MKYIKKIITILIIIIIILVGCIIYMVQYRKNINQVEEGDPGEELELNEDQMKDVTDRNRFFTVKNCVQYYLDEINDHNSNYFSADGSEKIFTEEEINQKRFNLLSKNFVDTNNININNINNYLNTSDSKVIFDALKMKYMIGEQVEDYVVYGITTSLDNEYIGNLYIRVNLDRENGTFSVEPLKNDYNSIEDVNVKYDGTSINSNDENLYSDTSMTYERVAKEYFSIYKRLILAKPDIIYDYLQTDYKNKRFGDVDTFIQYENLNKNEILQLQLTKYSVNEKGDYTEIVCMDQYQNFYVFDETNIMNMELKLDTYTLISDKFKTKYDSSNDQQKVALNIDKWIQMLNTRDYKNAYNMLDETFRKNNWQSEQEFETDMRKKLPLHYDVEYTTYSNENSTYVQTIKLSDITEKDDSTITMNIIMQLKDNYEFVMSFSIE